MEDKFEKLGCLIDSLDNITYTLRLPLPPEMHVKQLNVELPIIVKDLKSVFIDIAGENPWEYQ